MRNDAPDDSVAQRQAWRLAEISLEELAFVVMARAAACAGAGVEGEGDGSAHFSGVLGDVGSAESILMWSRGCETAAQGLRQMAQSTWRPMECNAAARELEAWCTAGASKGGPISSPEVGEPGVSCCFFFSRSLDKKVYCFSSLKPIFLIMKNCQIVNNKIFGAHVPCRRHYSEDALRMRASLQRAQRLVEAHTTALLEVGIDSNPSSFPPPPPSLSKKPYPSSKNKR